MTVFETFHRQAFKQFIILSAFRKTDIVSYNSTQILGPLTERIERARREKAVIEIEEEEEDTDLKRPRTFNTITEL